LAASGLTLPTSIVFTKRPRPEIPVSVMRPRAGPRHFPNSTTGRSANTSASATGAASWTSKPS
jgi:hypothetical protein